jgi:hypothetical protein
MNPKIDAGVFESMSISQIDTMLDRLYEREQRIIDESPYGSWLSDPTFVQIKILQDGLNNLREHREYLEETETLVPGFTYYDAVRRFGHRLEGRMCMYLGESRPVTWVNFIDSVPIIKALEVIKHGNTNDFRRLYVESANGRADGLTNISIEHIIESSDAALHEMESYCDARWEGPWPWEVSAPYRLGRIIEEDKQMRQQPLIEMHQILNKMLFEFDAGGQENFAILSMLRGMSDNVQAMIEKFAKIAGDAMINLRAAVMSQSGDEGAMKVEHGLTQAVNQAADALARLKVEMDNLVNELQLPPGSDIGTMGGMGGMGGGDTMGGGDMGGDMGGGEAMPGADDSMPAGPMGAGGEMAGAGAEMGAGPPAGMPPGEGMQPERPRKKA